MSTSLLNAISPSIAPSVSGGSVSKPSSVSTDIEFSHSFLTQMQALQKSGEIPKDIRESRTFQKMTRLIADSEGQSTSVLLGEKLPQIKEVKDINLDKTMTTLKGILGQLETLSKNNKEVLKPPKLSRIDKTEGQDSNREEGDSSALLGINQLPVLSEQKLQSPISLNGKATDDASQIASVATEVLALQATITSKAGAEQVTKIDKSKEKDGIVKLPADDASQIDSVATEVLALQATTTSKEDAEQVTKIDKSKEKDGIVKLPADDASQIASVATEVLALQATTTSKVGAEQVTKIDKSKEKGDVLKLAADATGQRDSVAKASAVTDNTGQRDSVATEVLGLQATTTSKVSAEQVTKIDKSEEKGDVLKLSADKVNKDQPQPPLATVVNMTTLPIIEVEQSQQADRVMPQVLRQTNSLIDDKKQSAVISSLTATVEERGLKPEVNIAHLLKRENLLNKAQVEVSEFKMDALTSKILDVQTSNMSQSGDSASQKFAAIDLSALNRQIDGAVTKTELLPMTKPFNHPEWKQEFNERIVWMHNKAIPSAELRLNPNNLGPIAITIKMDQDQQASIQIQAHHAGVRDAIESSIPRLREMLNTQQINLSDVNVSQQQQGQGSARQAMQDVLNERAGNNTSDNHEADGEGSHTNAVSDEINQGRVISSKGLVSLYV